jgi:hypothetical protein
LRILLAGLEPLGGPGGTVLSFIPSINMAMSKLPQEDPPSVEPMETVVGNVVAVPSLWMDLDEDSRWLLSCLAVVAVEEELLGLVGEGDSNTMGVVFRAPPPL